MSEHPSVSIRDIFIYTGVVVFPDKIMGLPPFIVMEEAVGRVLVKITSTWEDRLAASPLFSVLKKENTADNATATTKNCPSLCRGI